MNTESFLDNSNIYTEAESTLNFSHAPGNKPLHFRGGGMVACFPHTILRNKVSIIYYLGKEHLEISDNKNSGNWKMLTSANKVYHVILRLLIPLYVFILTSLSQSPMEITSLPFISLLSINMELVLIVSSVLT